MDTVLGIFSLQLHSNERGKIYYRSHFPEAPKTKRFSWGHAVLEYYAENPVQASPHKNCPPTHSHTTVQKFTDPLESIFFGPLFKALRAGKGILQQSSKMYIPHRSGRLRDETTSAGILEKTFQPENRL